MDRRLVNLGELVRVRHDHGAVGWDGAMTMADCSVMIKTLGVPGPHLPMTDESLTVLTSEPDDGGLLQRIRRGEIGRFADLITRYQRHVIRIVSRRVPADRAEEVTHDVFVRAYFGLAQFSGSVSFDHWLAGIAVRTCYDFWRGQRAKSCPSVR